jgi:hypothetical protein
MRVGVNGEARFMNTVPMDRRLCRCFYETEDSSGDLRSD